VLGRDPLIPSKRLLRYGRADFVERGDAYLGLLRDLAALQPGHRVADVGCGFGRVARPLAGFLDAESGSYDGFDVDRAAVGFCRRRYARRHRRFRFLRADLFHPRFHPGGAHRAAEYRFPYDDASFDVVIATSVYPHMLEEEAAHYLEESARVLAPGGRLFAAFFVLDDDSRARIASGAAGFAFLDAAAHVAVVSEDLPEEAVAYSEAWLAEHLAAGGLALETLTTGSWRGSEDAPDLLDIVVARHA
jgi:SAM-dependent methyltransferase